MKRSWKSIGLLLFALVILGCLFFTQITSLLFPNLMHTAENAAMMYSYTQEVIDSNGELLKNYLPDNQRRIKETFTEDSFDSYNLNLAINNIWNNYSETSDAVLDNELLSFRVRSFRNWRNKATVVVKTAILQKYIPYNMEQGTYMAFLVVAKETRTIELIKDNSGNWKVSKMNTSNYLSGTPQEMGITKEDYKKSFETRKEACDYLNSLDLRKTVR